MARQVITTLVDDIDGSEAAESLTFAMDGVTYEIDLTDVHAKELREVFAPYVQAGRRVSRTGVAQTVSASAKKRENEAIRAWATANDWAISERGRIPSNVMDAYQNRDAA